jgi:hypothetical protein
MAHRAHMAHFPMELITGIAGSSNCSATQNACLVFGRCYSIAQSYVYIGMYVYIYLIHVGVVALVLEPFVFCTLSPALSGTVAGHVAGSG